MQEQEKYISISQLTRYIKFKFDTDDNLKRVYLKGEISNFKAHTRGHYYFTLKDESSRINAVMFASSVSKMRFLPEDGMKVLVTGRISVYEATGGYQIYVDDMIEDGIGNLYIQFEQLKKKLAAEGLFNEEHKKPIPKIPSRIGVVTASTGAAIRDILSTIRRRWPFTETILFPSLVQGASAAPDIVRQIEKAQEYNLDVLIVGRGGGSVEDMWCFNEEVVARAIYHSNVPVISAVGHEIDFTIADFVADLRAPTPTGAAEMAVPSRKDVLEYMKQLNLRLDRSMSNIITTFRKKLNGIQESYILENPASIYQMKEQKFDTLFDKLQIVMKNITSSERLRLDHLLQASSYGMTQNMNNQVHRFEKSVSKLEILNPLLTIGRGYSITKKNSKVVSSISDIKKKDLLEIELKDGMIQTEVLGTKEKGRE